MKLITLIFGLMLTSSLLFAQADTTHTTFQNEYPVVEIHLEEQTGIKIYTFVSNLQHDEYKNPLFIKRMRNKYPEIIDLVIDVKTQQVSMVMVSAHSEEKLLEIIKKFKYSDYEIK